MNGLPTQTSLSTLIQLRSFLYNETIRRLGARPFRKQRKIKLRISQRALSYRTYMANFSSMDFKKSLLRYNLQTLTFAHFKCMIQSFSENL